MQSNQQSGTVDTGDVGAPSLPVVQDKPKNVAASAPESNPSHDSPSNLTTAANSSLSTPGSSGLAETAGAAGAANSNICSPDINKPVPRVAPSTTLDSIVPYDRLLPSVSLALWRRHLEKDDDDECGCESTFGRDEDGEVRHYGEGCQF
ncbi:hypothetical protein FPV67DRAFT_1453503 [Lyophyllum atratum]|nr:hypothetical protein FPV67DRAFT_1454141 [Lyophyllum atratum]KAF8059878.1 hypothetical protein FPV67DRAFT_1453503 [Lyophyllum atratum]